MSETNFSDTLDYIEREATRCLQKVTARYKMEPCSVVVSGRSLLLMWKKESSLYSAMIRLESILSALSVYKLVLKAVQLQQIRTKKNLL